MNDTEKNILCAATKLFASKGYDATKTKEIAEAAGISEVTLFKYFTSKKALYLKVSSEDFNMLMFKEIFEKFQNQTFENLIRNVIIEVANQFYKNKEIISMHIKEKSGLMPERDIKTLENPLYKLTLPHFIKAVENNEIVGNPEKLCGILLLTVRGICIQSIFMKLDAEVLSDLIKTHLDVFFNGVLVEREEV